MSDEEIPDSEEPDYGEPDYGEPHYVEPQESDDHALVKPRDPQLDPAKASLKGLFKSNPRDVFYGRQLEVLLEKDHFHWITHKALNELTKEGNLIASEARTMKGGNQIRLYWSKQNRYWRRAGLEVVKLVEEHSSPDLSKAVGHTAEMLFAVAAASAGFSISLPSIKEFGGRRWTETEHDLDRVVSSDGISWGAEIKNTWAYIDRSELRKKSELCAFYRPALIHLLEALAANGTKLVLIEKLDRLARDLMVQETIIGDIRKGGFDVLSVMEPDLLQNDPTRILMRQVFGAIAQYEKAMIVAKLRGARQRKKTSTGRCEGRKPYGDFAGEDVVITRINALRQNGLAFDRIADKLNDEGYRSRTGGRWHGFVVNRIMSRPSA